MKAKKRRNDKIDKVSEKLKNIGIDFTYKSIVQNDIE